MTTDKVELNADIGLTGGDKLESGAKAEAGVRANRVGPLVDGTAVETVLTVKVDALMDIDVMAGNEEIGGDETSSKVGVTDEEVEAYSDSGGNGGEFLGNVPIDGVYRSCCWDG